MSDFTITIVGTGVIGTSIGLALKQQPDAPRLIAHDKELSHAKAALKMGAFDKTEWNLINACEQADLIILAIPLSGVRPTLEAIADYLKQGVVISDTCSNKALTLAWAEALLPEHAHFVGGNPVVHPAGNSYTQASADLFKNRLYCLTPAVSANEEAVQLMVGLVALLGAEPFFLDAAEHDGLAAAIEYLPDLLSIALMRLLSQQSSWRELRKIAGRVFEQVSAGAEGDPDSLKDNFLQNRETLVHWLDAYIRQLRELRDLVAAEEAPAERLAQQLDDAILARRNWLADYQKGRFTDPELISPRIENPGLLSQMMGLGAFRKRKPDSPKTKKDDSERKT
jgi:prephenate dehydrogenase